MLPARGQPGDQEAARELFDQALTTAREPDLHRLLAQCTTAPEALPRGAGAPAPSTGHASPAGLSAREVEVLGLLAAGATNKEIAAALVLSPGTVTQHLVNIYTKIGARRRADAAAFALQHGLAPPPQR